MYAINATKIFAVIFSRPHATDPKHESGELDRGELADGRYPHQMSVGVLCIWEGAAMRGLF